MVDSIIIDGSVEVNESCITGEADLVYKKREICYYQVVL